MTRLLKHSLLSLSLVLVSACATKAPPDDIISPERAMIFGHVEAEFPIDAVDFHEYGVTYIQPFKRPPRILVFRDGYFMGENIKPGKYYISAFYSGNKKYTLVNSKQSAYQVVINVRPGTLQFVGAHRIDVFKRELLGRGEFEVVEVMRPGERQALQRMFSVTTGTGWQKKIARRMKELRQ
ncbi:MAG: hypothetical protein OEZ33_04050 [Gammaproteobacteria bacterium]|nr:hypothetical protein [Gammaproteobacteria bacterium]MDH5777361.1 hypothetical protein [Gammaproteobacteria bacterium]